MYRSDDASPEVRRLDAGAWSIDASSTPNCPLCWFTRAKNRTRGRHAAGPARPACDRIEAGQVVRC